MATSDSGKVLVDTSAWIEFFRKAEPVYSKVSTLLESGRICTLGIVIAELIQGVRSEDEVKVLEDFVHVFELLPERVETWREAGKLSWRLRRRGKTVGLADCYVAVAASAAGASVFSLDRHFELMEAEGEVRRYEPAP